MRPTAPLRIDHYIPELAHSRLRRRHRSAPAGHAFRDLVLRGLPRPVRGGAEAGTGVRLGTRGSAADVPGTLHGVPASSLPAAAAARRSVSSTAAVRPTCSAGWPRLRPESRFPGLVGELVWSRIGAEFDADIGDRRGGHRTVRRRDLRDPGRPRPVRSDDHATAARRLTGGRWCPTWWLADTLAGGSDSRGCVRRPVRTTTGCPAAVYRNQFWLPYPDAAGAALPRHPWPDGLHLSGETAGGGHAVHLADAAGPVQP